MLAYFVRLSGLDSFPGGRPTGLRGGYLGACRPDWLVPPLERDATSISTGNAPRIPRSVPCYLSFVLHVIASPSPGPDSHRWTAARGVGAQIPRVHASKNDTRGPGLTSPSSYQGKYLPTVAQLFCS